MLFFCLVLSGLASLSRADDPQKTVPVSSSANMAETVKTPFHPLSMLPSPFSNWGLFKDFYGEGTYFNRVHTNAIYGQLRAGLRSPDFHWEAYAVARGSADTRTGGNPFQIYNDNYLFTGVGVDRLGLLPGVRLIAQGGYSFDLKKQINRQGFDTRLGGAGYYEIPLGGPKWHEEIYADAFYIGRYGYAISTAQFRTFYRVREGKVFGHYDYDLSPFVNFAGSVDTQGNDYNRFVEERLGARLSLRGKVSAALWPQYVFGTRWGRPTSLPAYHDVRILGTVFFDF